ncbi:MAG: hypothetical protein V1739_06120 [Candidatus Omnitrophota bacterium]
MKRLLLYFIILIQPCSIACAQTQRLSLEQYCPVLAECNIAAYSAIRHVIFNAGSADTKKLKSFSSAFSKLVNDFESKLAELEQVCPQESETQIIHRLFIKQYRQINLCMKDLENDFSSGNNYALLGNIAKGKYLFRDLKDIYEIFSQSLRMIVDKEASK